VDLVIAGPEGDGGRVGRGRAEQGAGGQQGEQRGHRSPPGGHGRVPYHCRQPRRARPAGETAPGRGSTSRTITREESKTRPCPSNSVDRPAAGGSASDG